MTRWLAALICALLALSAQALVGGAKGVQGGSPHGTTAAAADATPHGTAGRSHAAHELPSWMQSDDGAQAHARESDSSAPWAAAPALRVRFSGHPSSHAAQLRALDAELATQIDPQRVRAGSLVDDAYTADVFRQALGRDPDAAARQFFDELRAAAPDPDRATLARALAPMQGDTLLLMVHIDTRQAAVVFRAPDGSERRVSVPRLELAAQDAGVQLFMLGCESGRFASAGYSHTINSLDAARAIARAVNSKPATLFDLYAAASGPTLFVTIDAQRFRAERLVELRAVEDGPVVSELHWSGIPHTRPGFSEDSQMPPLPGMLPPWAWLALGSAASLLLAAGLAWRAWHNVVDLQMSCAIDLLLHLLLLPLWLATIVKAAAGANASLWAWMSLWFMLPAWIGFIWGSRVDRSGSRWIWQLGIVRVTLLAVPLAVLAAHHAGWTPPPPALQTLLRNLFALGQALPGADKLIFGAALLAWAGKFVLGILTAPFVALHKTWTTWTRLAGRREAWHAQLAAASVPPGKRRQAAVRARAAFEAEVVRNSGRPPVWQSLVQVSTFEAPDPWTGHTPISWRLLMLMPPSPALRPWYGLAREGHDFVHPLPPPLVECWERGALQRSDLPAKLARAEPRLRASDFATTPLASRVNRKLLLCGAVVAALSLGLAWRFGQGSTARLTSLLLAGAVLLLMVWPVIGVLLSAMRRARLRRIARA